MACLVLAVAPPIVADTYSGGTQNEPAYFDHVPPACQGLAERYRAQTRELHAVAERLRDTTFPASQAVIREIGEKTRKRQVTRKALDDCQRQAGGLVPGLSPPMQGVLDPGVSRPGGAQGVGPLTGRVATEPTPTGPPGSADAGPAGRGIPERADAAPTATGPTGGAQAGPGRAGPAIPGRAENEPPNAGPAPRARIMLRGNASATMAPDVPPAPVPQPPLRVFSSPERVVSVQHEGTRTITTRIRVDIGDFDLHDGDYQTSVPLDGKGGFAHVHGTVERANRVFVARELTDLGGRRAPLSRPVRMPLSQSR